MPSGSLVIVGTGIKLAAHITVESQAWIQQADKVFFLVDGPVADEWIRQLNSEAEDLGSFYDKGKRRLDTYLGMVEHILAVVRQGHRVCAVFYGHPGVFVLPAHKAIRQARQEGFEAAMLPGVSAEDCLFADLGIDPAQNGCQSYEATDFLVRPRQFDTTTGLILWQIGMVGNLDAPVIGEELPGLAVLVEVLETHYGPDHHVVIYEAARDPISDPMIQHVPLSQALNAKITPISTMYVPSKETPAIDPVMMARLGLSIEAIQWNR